MKKFILFAVFLALAFSGCKTAMPETQTTNLQTDNREAQETVKIGEGIYKVNSRQTRKRQMQENQLN